MNQLFDFIKKTGIVGVSQIIGSILSYLILIIITREFGAEGLGVYSFLLSFSALFFLLNDFGFGSLMLREVSLNPKLKNIFFSQLMYLKLFLGLLFVFIYFISIFFIDRNDIMIFLFLIGFYRLFSLFSQNYSFLFRLDNSAWKIASGELLERFIVFLGAIISGLLLDSFTIFVIFLVSGQILLFFYYFFISRRDFLLKHLDIDFIKKKLPIGIPFIFFGSFMFILSQFDIVMLSFMTTDKITGYYNASYRLLDVLNIIPSLFLIFGFPSFSRLYKKQKPKLSFFLEKTLYYMFALMVAISIGVLFLAERILDFIYDFNSLESVGVLQIIIFGQLFILLIIPLYALLAAAGKQKMIAYITGASAILNISLNFILIPYLSLYGAAIATVISYFILFLLLYVKARQLVVFNIFRRGFVLIISSFFLVQMISILDDFHISIIILGGAFVYLIPLIIVEYYFETKKFLLYRS